MRITSRQLRQIIRDVLTEDLAGFRKRTEHIRYGAGLDEWNPNTTFVNDPENRAAAKAVKSAWAAEADHAFMRSLTKVHWIVYPEQASTFMEISGKNEISAKGYLPSAKIDRPLGGVGFIVQGRVTLAANSQDTIYSGMSGHLPPEIHKHFALSGTPKRARKLNNWISANYMLDEKSFMPEQHNELIVDNWKIIAIIIDVPKVLSSFTGSGRYDWTPAMRPIIESGFPLYNMDMKPVSPGMILQAMKDAEGKPKVNDFDQKMSEGNLGQLTNESAGQMQQRFTDREHRLAARLVDRLNDAVYDIANKRIKQDGHFLTRDEAEEYFQTLFDALPPGPFESLEDLRAAHREFTDILMRRAER